MEESRPLSLIDNLLTKSFIVNELLDNFQCVGTSTIDLCLISLGEAVLVGFTTWGVRDVLPPEELEDLGTIPFVATVNPSRSWRGLERVILSTGLAKKVQIDGRHRYLGRPVDT